MASGEHGRQGDPRHGSGNYGPELCTLLVGTVSGSYCVPDRRCGVASGQAYLQKNVAGGGAGAGNKVPSDGQSNASGQQWKEDERAGPPSEEAQQEDPAHPFPRRLPPAERPPRVCLLSRRAWSCFSGRNRPCLRHNQKDIEEKITLEFSCQS